MRKAAEDVGRAHGRQPQAEQNKCWTFAPKSLVTTRLKRDTALGSVERLGDAALEKQFSRLFSLVRRYDEPEELARLLRRPGEGAGGDEKASAAAAAEAAKAARAAAVGVCCFLLSLLLLHSPFFFARSFVRSFVRSFFFFFFAPSPHLISSHLISSNPGKSRD